MDQGSDPDLTIVLLGKAGVGKSTSGNTILGPGAFESRLSFKPVTKTICEKTGSMFGKHISVIDTPGILCAGAEEQVRTRCQKVLQSSRPKLFLVLIRVGRFTEEDQKAVEAAVRALGDEGLKHSYLLFTGGDILKDMTLEDFIFEEEEGSLPDVVYRFSGRYHLFNNEDQYQDQVRDLLLKSGHLTPDAGSGVRPEDRRIVLLGLPGVGKSSSGNTILGSDQFESDCSFNSVTTESVYKSATVESRQVTVVDTPGFTDEVLTPEQVFMEIMKMIVEARPGPHAFVIVVSLDRISEAEIKMFEILQLLFGSDAFKYVMVLFTHGDKLKRPINDLIQTNEHVSKLISMCGGRLCVFDNTKRGNRQQIRNLLSKIDEMVTANDGEHYTNEMFRMAETFIKEEMNRFIRPTEVIPSGPPAARVPSGPPAARVPSGPPAARVPSGPPAARVPSGPPAARVPSGPPAARVPSGPPAARVPSGPPAARVTLKEIIDRAWQRLKRFVRECWNRVCRFFTRLFEEIRSALTALTTCFRNSAGSESQSTETELLIKKQE